MLILLAYILLAVDIFLFFSVKNQILAMQKKKMWLLSFLEY